MLSNVREGAHVLPMNTKCSHLHDLCTAGVSSGLAARVTLARMCLGRLRDGPASDFIFVRRSTWLFKCYSSHTSAAASFMKGLTHIEKRWFSSRLVWQYVAQPKHLHRWGGFPLTTASVGADIFRTDVLEDRPELGPSPSTDGVLTVQQWAQEG
jgi:hypothetical protein